MFESALIAVCIAAYCLILDVGRARAMACRTDSRDRAVHVTPVALKAAYWLALCGVVLVVAAAMAPKVADRALAPAGLQIAQSR
jgi:hypothetical protein